MTTNAPHADLLDERALLFREAATSELCVWNLTDDARAEKTSSWLRAAQACEAGALALRAQALGEHKRSMEFFASEFFGLGVGKAGDCRVVVRTHKKTFRELIQIIDDSDGVGLGFTPREVPALIAALTNALRRLSPVDPLVRPEEPQTTTEDTRSDQSGEATADLRAQDRGVTE